MSALPSIARPPPPPSPRVSFSPSFPSHSEPLLTLQTAESATLLPPPRDASILSLEAGYGAVDTASIGAGASNGGLSGEQRARIEEIGREVGS